MARPNPPKALAAQGDSPSTASASLSVPPKSLTDARARRQQAYLRGIRAAKRLFRREAAA